MALFLSTGEVADLLGVSVKFVYRHKHSIPGGFKLGGSYFWDKEVLLSELRRQAKRKSQEAVNKSADHHRLI